MIDFHVIYTPGTVRHLLPFGITLLQATEARFVLVDNGCPAVETEQLRLLATSEPRFSYLRLPGEGMVPHGEALGFLLERCEDQWFAMLDSDILATGDFLADLAPPSGECAGVFTASPVWLLPPLARASRESPFLGGPINQLPDGTPVGSTSAAIYNREALEVACSNLSRGLLNGAAGRVLQPGMAQELRARGWYFRRFGTGRVANLRLLLDGFTLRNVATRHLHHLGGVSHRDEQQRPPFSKRLRRFTDRMLHGERTPLLNLLTNSRTLLQQRTPEQERQVIVRRIVTLHVLELMSSLRGGGQIPDVPNTGDPAVNERLMTLHEALVDLYPGAYRRLEAVFSLVGGGSHAH